MVKKEKAGPDTTSAAYDYMSPKWARAEALLGGTPAMKKKARDYLPQHAAEENKSYAERLSANYLFNMFELTLESMVGRPFSDDVELDKDTPQQILDMEDDINLQGDNLSTFCREWFRDGMAKCFSHVMIDYPTLSEEDMQGRTLADDLREKRRPYWVHVKPENVLAMFSEVIDGVETLTHVRIHETVIDRVGFEEVATETIKVLERGTWQVYKKVVKGRKEEWIPGSVNNTGLEVIPFVSFYAARDGLMRGKPPLDDLTHLNIRHWQSNSDQISVTTVARFPILAVAGATDSSGSVMKIGPKQVLGTRDPSGKFYYVEHTGKAIDAGAKDLAALEDQMAAYGAEFLRKKPGGITATARALDSAESSTPLGDMITRFTDAVNQALKISAMWLNLEDGGKALIENDFGPEEAQNVDMRSLNEMRRNRDISRKGYLEEMKRRGALGDDFDIEGDLDLLQDETIILSPFATGANVTLGEAGSLGPDDDKKGGKKDKDDKKDKGPKGPGKANVKQPGSDVTGDDPNAV